MNYHSLFLTLMFVLGVAFFSPANASAAETPAEKVSVEIIHLNQANAEQLQGLTGVGPAAARLAYTVLRLRPEPLPA